MTEPQQEQPAAGEGQQPETEATPAAAQNETPQPPTAPTDAPETAAADAVTLGDTPVATAEETEHRHVVPKDGLFWGLGRRKTSVARVRLIPGDGKFFVNKREVNAYFTEELDRNRAYAALKAVGVLGKYDVHVNVKGGGHTGQAGAVLLGVARALVAADKRSEPQLREAGYLTRDSRRVERKKYGRRKARRRFQFSKR